MKKHPKNEVAKEQTPWIVIDTNELNPAEQEFAKQFGDLVIGQPQAARLAQVIYAAKNNPLRDKRRPIGVYKLIGPSRTGKSLTAEVLALLFHGNVDALTRLEAADYEDDHETSDLKGAPPSYIGYRDPTDSKNRLHASEADPYSKISQHNLTRVRLDSKEVVDIVVIEEFEKSSENFYKLWMGIFDKGILRLRNGQVVDFRNTIFILTSNLGTDEIERVRQGTIGFGGAGREATEGEIKNIVDRAMERRYRKEFRNRLDGVVIFRNHTPKDVADILDVEISKVEDRITDTMPRGQEFEIDVTDTAKAFILAAAGSQVAELKRVINQHLMTVFGHLLHPQFPKVRGGDIVRVSHKPGDAKLTFEIAAGGFRQAGAEGVEVYGGDSPETMSGLAFQRRVERAKRKSTGRQSQWLVEFGTSDKDELIDEARALMHDLEQVFGLFFDWPAFARKAPWKFTCTVAATDEQMTLVRSKYAALKVTKVESQKEELETHLL